MRLLHTETQILHEFIGDDIPPYAILSHRWASLAEEPTFRDACGERLDCERSGFSNVKNACRVVKDKYELSYKWIDTCCINKESSAELSEAINSMFMWYKNATVCLAFLSDVGPDPEASDCAFRQSEWFTRAWTLQELLAPRVVEFFNNAWESIGTKADRIDVIEEITNIPCTAIEGSDCLWEFQMAEKMTWASGRRATRTEDIAYSLMGLFEVNIPLLYGEGNRAFVRLQKEIIRSANNLAFLQWGIDVPTHRLLADAPGSFEWNMKVDGSYANNVPFTWTNLGLKLDTLLFRFGIDLYGIILNHQISLDVVAMILRKHSSGENLYYKVCTVVLPYTDYEMSCKTTITIMRGTKDQQIGNDNLNHAKYDRLREPYLVEFRCHRNITLQPDMLRGSFDTIVVQRTVVTNFVYEAEYLDPCQWAIASLVVKVANASRFRVLFAFDFDWQACLLVENLSARDQAPQPSPYITLLRTLAYSPAKDFAIHHADEWMQSRPRKVERQEGESVSLFRVNKDERWYARLPDDFSPKDLNIWLSFRRTEANKWLVGVSTTAPCTL